MVDDLCMKWPGPVPSEPVTVVRGDFLGTMVVTGELTGRGYSPDPRSFKRIIANPPFNNGQDAAHITRMLDLLDSFDGLLTVIVPHGFLATSRGIRVLEHAIDVGFALLTDDEIGVDMASGSGVKLQVIQFGP